MTNNFAPFTPAAFKEQTGMNAADNDAIYLRWVNTQVNYAAYQQMCQMNHSLRQLIELLQGNSTTQTMNPKD